MPDLLFRLLGYGGLVVVVLLRNAAAPSAALYGLLAYTLLWPVLWGLLVRRWPALIAPRSAVARLAHTGECLTISVLVTLADLGFWLVVAVGVLCLAGITALGGLRLLAPAATVVGGWLVLAGRLDLVRAADGWTLAGALVTVGFLLALTWLCFTRVRRLEAHRRFAVNETAVLKDHNARLARYLPGELPPLIVTEPRALQHPREHFATVAFVDVVGFVELVAARPVMELVEVLNDFMTTVVALTERRGGVVGKFLGDGVLVYFADAPEAPAGQRWRAAAACARLCLELGPALEALARTWRRQGLTLELAVRAGMASGCCAIGDWGGGSRLDYTLIGMPVNLASRLQVQADAGGILLTTAAATLVSEDPELACRLENLGTRDIRGAGPVVVHGLRASAKVRAIPLPVTPASKIETP